MNFKVEATDEIITPGPKGLWVFEGAKGPWIVIYYRGSGGGAAAYARVSSGTPERLRETRTGKGPGRIYVTFWSLMVSYRVGGQIVINVDRLLQKARARLRETGPTIPVADGRVVEVTADRLHEAQGGLAGTGRNCYHCRHTAELLQSLGLLVAVLPTRVLPVRGQAGQLDDVPF